MIPACEKEKQLSTCYQRGNKDHIVLISEWDTQYGRQGLPDAMHTALHAPGLGNCIKMPKKNEKECLELDQKKWVHQFSYMRGLDGVVPGEEKKAEEGRSNKDKDKNKPVKSVLERPEGQSQKDYLRRLARQVGEIERDLENKGEGNILAIGVLGSDVYDKLMILQALRPMFPKAVFFTTDLDTRLMHPEDFDVTRNLVVAASFGLQLEKNIQKSVPPFRDSNQTANFLATQIVIDNANGKKISQDEINKKLGSARLFETGFNKAIDLSEGNSNCSFAQECESYHPQTYRAWPSWKLVFVGVSIVCIILFVYLLSENFRTLLGKSITFTKNCAVLDKNLYNQFRLNPICVLILLLILVVLGMTGYEIYLGNEGEPFSWSEGVSIWPTEIIRLIAVILGCVFIICIDSRVKRNKQQLLRLFCLNRLLDDLISKKDHDLRVKDKCVKHIKRLCSLKRLCHALISNKDDDLQDKDKRVNVSILWDWYCLNTSAPSRNIRVLRTTILFLIFGWSLLNVIGFPNVPYRGAASLLANNLALFLSVTIFVILVMMVIDETWRSIDLITRLSKNTSVWPTETLRHFDLDFSSPEAVKLKKLRDDLDKGDKYFLNDWIDIQFIAAHTKEVGKFVYYPAIILILMIFARSRIFDNWNMPLGLTLILLSSAGLTIICAFRLRHTAEYARQNVFRQISSMLIGLSSRSEAEARTLEKQASIALKQIQEINEGAFRPLVQEPAIQALLLPFGGWGGVTLLEYFVMNGF